MECLCGRLQPEASDRHGRRARGSAPAPAGSDSLGNGFVLAAQAGMEMTGKTVEHRDGKLVAVD